MTARNSLLCATRYMQTDRCGKICRRQQCRSIEKMVVGACVPGSRFKTILQGFDEDADGYCWGELG